jgi:D-amino peptidase
VPSVFVSGDAGVCAQARELLPHIGTAAVKEGAGDSTTSIHPQDAVAAIREGVVSALRDQPERCLPELPEHFDLHVRFKRHQHAYRASFYPGMERVDAHTVRLRDGDYRSVLAALLFVL